MPKNPTEQPKQKGKVELVLDWALAIGVEVPSRKKKVNA